MSFEGKNILVTGAAGFIGFHLTKKLCSLNCNVFGLDCINNYYDINLKYARLDVLLQYPNFKFFKMDIVDKTAIDELFAVHKFHYVIHLAAQAGVRYSLQNPYAYLDSNIFGFLNILEACRHSKPEHLIYASSSSVYGANKKMPFSVSDNVDHPLSLYAASKKTNELMAHTYSALFNIPTTGLRFFTVYGPWGRPDMAPFLFTKAILEDKPLDIYNYGKMRRDFTYIDDVVDAICKLIPKFAQADDSWDGFYPKPGSSFAPYRIFNVGNNNPIDLLHFISALENSIGKQAKKNMLPMQDGDVVETFADISDLANTIDFNPSTSIEKGIQQFVSWYQSFYYAHSEPNKNI